MRAITFDIDWAPDWTIALCADLCRRADAPATFFVTHQSDILGDLRGQPSIELGIHPNLLPNSTHGSTTAAVFETVLSFVPEAKSMRTHSLVQSTPMLQFVERQTDVAVDVSLLMPFVTGLKAFQHHLLQDMRGLIRLPYFWEDDIAAIWPDWDWSSSVSESEGLCIYDFHPIHVALNMASIDQYSRLKVALGNRPLQSATQADCAPFVHPGEGTRTFLERLLQSRSSGAFHTISNLAVLGHRVMSCA